MFSDIFSRQQKIFTASEYTICVNQMFCLQGRVKSAVYIYILKVVRFILLKSFILAAFVHNIQNKQQTNESQELFLFPIKFHIKAQ